jgi:hypothetical protein
MPKLEELSIGQVLPVLLPTFRSFDLRAVAVELSGQWTLVGGLIAASRFSPEEIKARHAILMQRSKPPETEHFKILFDAWPMEQADALLNGIDHGSIRVCDVDLLLAAERPWAPIRDQKMLGAYVLSSDLEDKLFRRYVYSVRAADSAEKLLTAAHLDPSTLRQASWADLNFWLEVPYFDGNRGTAVYLQLSLTVYVALQEAVSIADGQATAEVVVHSRLRPHISVRGWIRHDWSGSLPLDATDELTLPSLPSETPDAGVTKLSVPLPLDIGKFQQRRLIEVGLFHDSLGRISEVKTYHGQVYHPIPLAAVVGVQQIDPPASEGQVALPDGFRYLAEDLRAFLRDHPDPAKNVFLMMRFRTGQHYDDIARAIRDEMTAHGLNVVRADDKDYTGDLWTNVCVYMLGCSHGIAVFEEIDEREFNPSVALELGFMEALNKRCLLLKDGRMPKMPTDIVGKLYEEFDIFNIDASVRRGVRAWLHDLGLL